MTLTPAERAALRRHARDWQELGSADPMWAVLTEPSRRGRRWTPEAFLATGEAEVEELLAMAERHAGPIRRGAALDFGCGLGRLTLPLARRFEATVGVDVAAAMVAGARAMAASAGPVGQAPVFEVLEADGGLPRVARGPFDLVVSLYVLQHLPDAAFVRRTLAQVAAAVGPEGVLVVQLPAPIPLRHRIQPRRRAYAALRRLGLGHETLYGRLGLSPMRLVGLSASDVTDSLAAAGLATRRVERAFLSRSTMTSFTYVATRPAAAASGQVPSGQRRTR